MLKTIILTIAGLVFALVPLYELPLLVSIVWVPLGLASLYLFITNYEKCMRSAEVQTDAVFMYTATGVFALFNALAMFGMSSLGSRSAGESYVGLCFDDYKILVYMALGSAVLAMFSLQNSKNNLAKERANANRKASESNKPTSLADRLRDIED